MPKRLQDWIAHSKNMVFFGGAGVSTESGIPDFRSQAGRELALRQYGYPPEELLSHRFFAARPEIFFAYLADHLLHPQALPNAAHRALARLEREGRLSAVVTQNIDGLHQKAGSRNVFELHGSCERHYCIACGARYGLDWLLTRLGAPGVRHIPRCVCGGIVRPDVVLYQEPLDPDTLAGAAQAVEQADLLLVGGTSLAVYPAAGLLSHRTGGLILINRTATPYDAQADLVIHDSIGEVLGRAVP